MPLAATAALHAGLLAAIVLLSTGAARSRPVANVARQVRLVFLAAPGPGGGGGGGGTQAPIPASAALGRGAEPLRSPVPIRRQPVVRMPKVVRAVERPPVQVEPLPPVTAPVVPVAADARERAGIPVEPAPAPESQGTGTNAGAGTGEDGGLGAGTGAGIGPGSGGGTGGGPYRPGAGITPPALLVEVKPDYTEQARRQNIEGNVELEIVVRSDGRVGDVTLLHGLGAGLDQRAVDAVRQWRFSPARRSVAPVDVIVQVAVEFALR